MLCTNVLQVDRFNTEFPRVVDRLAELDQDCHITMQSMIKDLARKSSHAERETNIAQRRFRFDLETPVQRRHKHDHRFKRISPLAKPISANSLLMNRADISAGLKIPSELVDQVGIVAASRLESALSSLDWSLSSPTRPHDANANTGARASADAIGPARSISHNAGAADTASDNGSGDNQLIEPDVGTGLRNLKKNRSESEVSRPERMLSAGSKVC